MACLATLKRGHELDNYGQPFDLSPKRRRCSTNRSTFTPTPKSLQKDKKLELQSLSEGLSDSSQFPRLPELEPNQILNEVTAGYKQLKRRRLLPKSPTHQSPQLPGPSVKYSSPPTDARSSPSSSSDSDENSTSLLKIKKTISESIQDQRRCTSPESKKFTPDTQIRLTLRNVATICEALLRQREDTVREEYDKALQQKLSEQYEMFCRYSQDQLRQHKPSSSSSYIS
jgi:hypothetical protein